MWRRFNNLHLFLGTLFGIFLAMGLVALKLDEIEERRFAREDVQCLARNLAWESNSKSHMRVGAHRREAVAELEAIARVAMLRARLGRKFGYRDTICEVVYQEGQFSWTKTLPRNAKPKSKERWRFMLRMAANALEGRFETHWPAENACIVNYKRSDNKGVGKKPEEWFNENTRYVITFGDHDFFCIRDAKLARR
ncbi:hypothetical protein A2943_00375 [Candidatus Adlerbacteria bacterium RIFCSPLOWO2_01_FULL_51_16]|uniref:Cell wall hydrolase SleB domain-containing protein n=1 Tax=Candidatus Adlerbacteria bacterium RIFCSPLOWO2_01_FULL_51_16 TaxID=1797243 RepID=A0A1F4XHE4_9BACT|nr:MAG: hypothetical protein A2943_00375 [Candidatus Adlerbacteria bacterium RIFCSPLOWO2_01_FULL_51_16]